jgi:hypothetical protein
LKELALLVAHKNLIELNRFAVAASR